MDSPVVSRMWSTASCSRVRVLSPRKSILSRPIRSTCFIAHCVVISSFWLL